MNALLELREHKVTYQRAGGERQARGGLAAAAPMCFSKSCCSERSDSALALLAEPI